MWIQDGRVRGQPSFYVVACLWWHPLRWLCMSLSLCSVWVRAGPSLLPSHQASADLPTPLCHVWVTPQCTGYTALPTTSWDPRNLCKFALDLSWLTEQIYRLLSCLIGLGTSGVFPSPSNEAHIHSALGSPILSAESVIQRQPTSWGNVLAESKTELPSAVIIQI